MVSLSDIILIVSALINYHFKEANILSKEHIIPACSGMKIDVKQGQTITVIDIEGGQVIDFFAEVTSNPNEFLSTGVTIDCNESLKLKIGDIIYTNLYRPMLKILSDDVGEHDLLHPCCRPEMYDFFYHNGEKHPNCFDNINHVLEERHTIITPVNLFMHTKINTNGTISVEKPVSKAGDKIIIKALLDITLGVAACSISESKCNSGKCSPVKLVID